MVVGHGQPHTQAHHSRNTFVLFLRRVRAHTAAEYSTGPEVMRDDSVCRGGGLLRIIN